MFDYFKSEVYRIIRCKKIYKFIGICSALMLAMNIVLAYCNNKFEDFAYGNVRFALTTLTTQMNIPLVLTLVLSIIVFADEYKNGTINNSISYGISREKIYVGKILTTIFVSIPCLLIVEGTLVGSAYGLLEYQGMNDLYDLLKSNVACIPALVLGVVATMALLIIFESETVAIWSWVGIFVGTSFISKMLGMKFVVFKKLSKWLVYNTITECTFSKSGKLIMVWDTQEGLVRVVMAGIIGIVIFTIITLFGIKKKGVLKEKSI